VPLAGDSGWTAFGNAARSAADVAQIVIVTRLLGLTDYGRLALVVAVVTLVASVVDLRVSIVATVIGAEYAGRDWLVTAHVLRLCYRIAAVMGVTGVALASVVAVVVGPGLIGADGVLMLAVYSFAPLAIGVTELSESILRLFGRFRFVAIYRICVEAARVGLVWFAAAAFGDVLSVVTALVIYSVLGGGLVVAVGRAFHRASGESALRGSSKLTPALRRQVLRMCVHTNLASYARLAFIQLPTVFVGGFAGPLQAGVYKVGAVGANIIGLLQDPAYTAVLPRLSKLWASGRFADIRTLLRAATLVVVPVMLVTVATIVVFRNAIVETIGGSAASDATTVLVLACLAQAVNASLFWNTALLYAAGQSRAAAVAALVSVSVQVALLLALVPAFGAIGAGVSSMLAFLTLNLVTTLVAVRLLRGRTRGSMGAVPTV
jgi:O-antigen/teichoic acid export membrane protein